jgi:hypothetical protein
MAQYLMPLSPEAVATAPSLVEYRRGVGTANGTAAKKEAANPTVAPEEVLRKYHFTFLIRHPRSSIPSYYRCTIPPLSKMTGWNYFDPREAGYKELRALFDYLVKTGHVGPRLAGTGERVHGAGLPDTLNGAGDDVEICVIDADDLLDNPYGIVQAYCKSVGMKYDPEMLKWGDEEAQTYARDSFEKWKGWHEDALESTELRPRTHVCILVT